MRLCVCVHVCVRMHVCLSLYTCVYMHALCMRVCVLCMCVGVRGI